jgi:hypothetical protein
VTTERGPARVHRERFISATELAEYAYCRRAWWLRVVRGERGEGESARFDAGRATHRRLFWRLALARALVALAALLAAAVLALWLIRRA